MVNQSVEAENAHVSKQEVVLSIWIFADDFYKMVITITNRARQHNDCKSIKYSRESHHLLYFMMSNE